MEFIKRYKWELIAIATGAFVIAPGAAYGILIYFSHKGI